MNLLFRYFPTLPHVLRAYSSRFLAAYYFIVLIRWLWFWCTVRNIFAWSFKSLEFLWELISSSKFLGEFSWTLGRSMYTNPTWLYQSGRNCKESFLAPKWFLFASRTQLSHLECWSHLQSSMIRSKRASSRICRTGPANLANKREVEKKRFTLSVQVTDYVSEYFDVNPPELGRWGLMKHPKRTKTSKMNQNAPIAQITTKSAPKKNQNRGLVLQWSQNGVTSIGSDGRTRAGSGTDRRSSGRKTRKR